MRTAGIADRFDRRRPLLGAAWAVAIAGAVVVCTLIGWGVVGALALIVVSLAGCVAPMLAESVPSSLVRRGCNAGNSADPTDAGGRDER